jgi:hypothetical protein
LSTSSLHRRKLVGVEFSIVRSTALSRPSFFAQAMSVMPCAIASDMPKETNLSLYASNVVCWKRTCLPSTSEMISAMSLKDRSSGPSSGTSSTPLQVSSSSRRDAAAAMSRVATEGSLRSPSIGEKNMPWFLMAGT